MGEIIDFHAATSRDDKQPHCALLGTIGSLPGWHRALAESLVRLCGADRARELLEEEIQRR